MHSGSQPRHLRHCFWNPEQLQRVYGGLKQGQTHLYNNKREQQWCGGWIIEGGGGGRCKRLLGVRWRFNDANKRRTFAKNAYLQHTLTRRHRPPLVTFLLLLHDFFGGAMVSFLYILRKHSSNTRPHDVCGLHKQPTPFYRCIHIPTTSVHATVLHFGRARARKWRYGHLKTMTNNNVGCRSTTHYSRRLPRYYLLLPADLLRPRRQPSWAPVPQGPGAHVPNDVRWSRVVTLPCLDERKGYYQRRLTLYRTLLKADRSHHPRRTLSPPHPFRN